MRGPSTLPMLRRRPLTATQVCTLPEQAPGAAAFYEPPRGGEREDERLNEERDAAAA
ncbi:MAG: hypothetical protein WCP77_06895 [Roseococcus sp.]